MTPITAYPLRKIVARPSDLTEMLECGHLINRPISLGEAIQFPSKAKRRRCYHCDASPALSSQLRHTTQGE